MAGLPLKSGADFYNLEAARLRLHNLGADPTEVGAGLIYFNTSTGLNTSQKVRVYTGNAWKTIAFSEDLDVASNADFLALKEKVDTLIGDGVDMDGIIESWKEVEAFLSGMSDTKSLMDLLNSKLDKTGGTISSDSYTPLFLDTTNDQCRMQFRVNNIDKALVGYNASYGAWLYNYVSSAYLGVKDDGTPHYNNNTLLHSGNVGEYTCKAININSDITDTDKAYVGRALSAWTNWGKATNNPNGVAYTSGLTISFAGNAFQIAKDAYDLGKLYVRMSNYQSDSIPSWSDWKTIAFTDSNVASAQALAHSNGTVGATVSEAGNLSINRRISSADDSLNLFEYSAGYLYLGYSLRNEHTTRVYGNKIEFLTGDTQRMLINSSGNVTIGASDLAQEYYKLAVGGSTFLLASKGTSEQPSLGNVGTGTHVLIGTDSYGLEMWSRTNGNFGMQVHRFDGTATAYNLNLQPIGGNVLIGTTTDNGAKLQVAGAVTMANTLSVEGQTTLSSLTFSSANTISIDGNGNIKLSAKSGTYWNVATPNGINALTCYYNGNVLIGTTTDNGSGAKLQVNGSVDIGFNAIGRALSDKWTDGNGAKHPWCGLDFSTPATSAYLSNYYGIHLKTNSGDLYMRSDGYVGIGTTAPTEKLHVVGNLHVTGNIIADGEVSAGGAAEEGGNAGGGGAFHSESIAVGATQTTIAHGLGTDDIVVSIYEKDGVSGRWSIILTDVEIVDANHIIVSFGSATTVEHKVVIMGAVA